MSFVRRGRHSGSWVSLSARIASTMVALVLAACGGGGGGSSTPVAPPAQPPSITAQPADAKIADGERATFTVTAIGSGPLTYQWQQNGADVAGAISASFTTPALAFPDNGSRIKVTVTGAGGSVTSNVATVTITPNPVQITRQPESTVAADGSAVQFQVSATGSLPMSYRWLRDGSEIPGATASTYATPALTLLDSKARFTVEVSNPTGTVLSSPALLTVTPVAPTITAPPTSLTVADRGSTTLSVQATGSAPLNYQWFRNGVPIDGATGSNLQIAATYVRNQDKFSVAVSNIAGTTTSPQAVLTVSPLAPWIISQPASTLSYPGLPVTLTTAVDGTPPLNYRWERSDNGGETWNPIPGANAATLQLAEATLADHMARFRMKVSNVASTIASDSATVRLELRLNLLAGGTGGAGFLEGLNPRFDYPAAVAVDESGTIYVADQNNSVVRRLGTDGSNAVVAGRPMISGYVNGSAEQARFNFIRAMVRGPDGTLYVSEYCAVRAIAKDGTVSSFVGNEGRCQPADGQGTSAGFSQVMGLAIDKAGTLYVNDGNLSQTIRKVTPDGKVSTLAGTFGQRGYANGMGAAAKFNFLMGLGVDSAGVVYTIDGSSVRRVEANGNVSLFAGRPDFVGNSEGDRLRDATFSYPRAIEPMPDGTIYVLETKRLIRIDKTGMVATLIGNPTSTINCGQRDGVGVQALLFGANGMTRTADNQLIIADGMASTIRRASADGRLTTIAGTPGCDGSVDGPAGVSQLNTPQNLLLEPDGNVLIAEFGGSRIRRYTFGNSYTQGMLSTVAGQSWGEADGPAADARFRYPYAMVRDASGNVYISDRAGGTIRKMSPTGMVSTFAGKAGEFGAVDGPASVARFKSPAAMAIDAAGNIYVGDLSDFAIRKITPDGVVSTFAGKMGSYGSADGPASVARLGPVGGMVFDKNGYLYFTDWTQHTIRRVSPDGSISLVAGLPNSPGQQDGSVAFARFNNPTALTIDASGNLYVGDERNGMVRRVGPDGYTVTLLGQSGMLAWEEALSSIINRPRGLLLRPNGTLLITMEGVLAVSRRAGGQN